jgi:hypothetical protein
MSTKRFDFFIAGIIQGSREDDGIFDQDYRQNIKKSLSEAFPASRIYCPLEHHPESVKYSNEKARSVFMKHIDMVQQMDCLIAYLPEASLGTAIEIWEAYHHRTLIVTITTLQHNWVVRLFSHEIFTTFEQFEAYIHSGQLKARLERGLKYEK